MPIALIPYMRMRVDDLPPREYWSTAQEDLQLATEVQAAIRRGVQRADEEEHKAQKAKQDAADQKRREKESLERLKARMG